MKTIKLKQRNMNLQMMKKYFLLFLAAPLLAACGEGNKDYDATGNFEATEVTVSAQQNGQLLYLNAEEGSMLDAGEEVGLVDTTQLWLKARQLGATRNIYATQRPDIEKQVASLRQQLDKAEQEQRRYAGLTAEGAANRKLLDDATAQVKVLRREIAAALSSLNNNTLSLNAQMSQTDIQRYEVLDNLSKCHVRAPLSGTVLEKYAESGEYATVGKPLFKMADMKHVFLRAYLTSAQLSRVQTGQTVTVFADYGGGKRKEYKGRVTWISDQSEFTPKTILTDDERADLVYAVKIAIYNDGGIKTGMYGEVKL